MRNSLKKATFIAALVALPSTGLAGTKVGDFDLSANVAITTDYVWRGVSQTGEEPAIQGGFDVAHDSGLYLGVWGSNINFASLQTTMEMDVYGGYTHEFENGFGLDVGVIRYIYPGALASSALDFTEYYLGANYSLHGLGLSAKYSYSPDFTGTVDAAGNDVNRDGSYVEVGAEYTLPQDFVIAAHYGHSTGEWLTTRSSYDDYSVGLSKEVLGFGLDVTYYTTDNDGEAQFATLPNKAADSVVFKVSKSF